MIDLFKEIDYSKEIQDDSELKHFLIEACRKVEQEESDYLRKIKKPELDDQLMNQFVVSGIPLVKQAQVEKFLGVFKNKLLGARGIGEKNGLIDITAGMDNGVGNHTLYLTYLTIADAKAAFNKLNNLKFDATNRMSCIWANELRQVFEEEEELGQQYKEPVLSISKEKREHNLDEQFRNQFLIREDKALYLQWLDYLDRSAKTALTSEFMQLGYPISKMVFSPKGSFLAVCCKQGVQLYMGGGLKYKGLLKHAAVVDVKFSGDERFVVSSNGNLGKSRENFVLWAVEEQIKIKSYRAHGSQSLESFQFSDDSLNLAVALINDITLYRLTSVQDLLRQMKAPQEEQHIIKAVYVQKIAWLKAANEIIVMCYELDYNPISASSTRIFLYNVETKWERKWRAWGQHAKNGQIHVSEKGEWVAISLRKFLKKGHFTTAVQIANLVKVSDALQISSIELRQDVGNISFDSINNRMAVISKDQTIKSINVRYIVSFYDLSMKQKNLEIVKLGQIGNNLQNRVVLASNGAFFALYNVTEESAERGRFSLGMIVKEVKDKGKKQLAFQFTKQNLMVNGMTFFSVDPSGRFILLGTEKGYQIWNFIGQIITKDTLQKNIHDVQWRPRMFNRLPQQDQKVLVEQQKEIRKKYEDIDDRRANVLFYQKAADKKQRKQDFLLFVERKKEWFRGYVERREKTLGFRDFSVRTDKYEVDQGFIDLQ